MMTAQSLILVAYAVTKFVKGMTISISMVILFVTSAELNICEGTKDKIQVILNERER